MEARGRTRQSAPGTYYRVRPYTNMHELNRPVNYERAVSLNANSPLIIRQALMPKTGNTAL